MALILIVDDNIDACRPLAMLLRHMGHKSECATSGEQALAFLQNQKPDLMILDVMMPGMDGMEVLRAVRANPQTAALPIVMFTAIADSEYQHHALKHGANDYWIKGTFDFGQLKDRVEQHVH